MWKWWGSVNVRSKLLGMWTNMLRSWFCQILLLFLNDVHRFVVGYMLLDWWGSIVWSSWYQKLCTTLKYILLTLIGNANETLITTLNSNIWMRKGWRCCIDSSINWHSNPVIRLSDSRSIFELRAIKLHNLAVNFKQEIHHNRNLLRAQNLFLYILFRNKQQTGSITISIFSGYETLT